MEISKLIAQRQECKKTYGYRRVRIWSTRKKCLPLNGKTVLRIMNKYGLLSEISRWKKYSQMGQQLHRYENLLERNFVAHEPNVKWVTDISYIHTARGALYLAMIRALYDGSIVAYKTGTEQTINPVTRTIHAAFQKEAATAGLQLRSGFSIPPEHTSA